MDIEVQKDSLFVEDEDERKNLKKIANNNSRQKQFQLFAKLENESKQLKLELIPRSIGSQKQTLFIKGETFIDLTIEGHNRISNLNYYKQVQKITIQKQSRIIFVDFSSRNFCHDSHEEAIQILQTHSNKYAKEIANKLVSQEENIRKDREVKKYIMDICGKNPLIRQTIIQKNYEFKQYQDFIVANLPKDRFFMVEEFSFDYQNMHFKMNGMGFNEAFAHLLGCDLNTIQEIYLRKGILEFITVDSRWEIINEFLGIQRDGPYPQNCTHEGRLNLVTFDDILIDAPYSATFFGSQSNNIFASFLHLQYQKNLFDRGFVILEVILSETHLKQINQIRENNLKKPNEEYGLEFVPQSCSLSSTFKLDQSYDINDFLIDVPYQAQTQYFFEKYYNNQTLIQQKPLPQDLNPEKTCGYKSIS